MLKILAAAIFITCNAFAGLTQYKPINIPISSGERLFIRGYEGSIKIKSVKSNKLSLKVSLETSTKVSDEVKNLLGEWIFSYKKEMGVVLINVKGPPSKKDWNKVLMHKNSIPSYHIVIEAPSIPLEISWRKGSVNINNWQDNIQISQLKGKVKMQETKGDIKAYLEAGELSLIGHNGLVEIETYAAKLLLDKVKGTLNVENFLGATQILAQEGGVNLTTFKGPVKIIKGSGQIDFKNKRSRLQIDQFDGEIRGNTEQGSVKAHLIGEVHFRVKSKDGNIDLKTANSGAFVNIGSKEGGLKAPRHLRLQRWPNLKTMTGQLRGAKKGNIHVRTESGNIVIR